MVDYKSRFNKNRVEPDNWPVRPEEDPQWNCRKAQPEDSLSTMKFNINDYVKTKHNQSIKTLNKLLTTYPS